MYDLYLELRDIMPEVTETTPTKEIAAKTRRPRVIQRVRSLLHKEEPSPSNLAAIVLSDPKARQAYDKVRQQEGFEAGYFAVNARRYIQLNGDVSPVNHQRLMQASTCGFGLGLSLHPDMIPGLDEAWRCSLNASIIYHGIAGIMMGKVAENVYSTVARIGGGKLYESFAKNPARMKDVLLEQLHPKSARNFGIALITGFYLFSSALSSVESQFSCMNHQETGTPHYSVTAPADVQTPGGPPQAR